MKFLLSIVLVAAVAVGVALALDQGGSITFWWSEWRADVAISTFLLFLFFIIIFIWLLSRIIFQLYSLPDRARKYKKRLKEKKRVEMIYRLLIAFFQKQYVKVVNDSHRFKKTLTLKDEQEIISSLLFYFITAKSANRVGNFQLRDSCIKEIEIIEKKNSKNYNLAVLFRFQYLIEEKKQHEALRNINKIPSSSRENIEFLKLQVKANELAEDWEEVLRLVRVLENKKNVVLFDFDLYKFKSFYNLFKTSSDNPVVIKKIIGLIKNDYKNSSKLTYLVSEAWLKVGNTKKAKEIVEGFLNLSWDSDLIMLYYKCIMDDQDKLEKLDEWEKNFSSHHEYHLVFGKTCRKLKMWGKSQQHLERSIQISPSVEALVELAEVYKLTEKEKAAQDCWKRAALLSLRS
ncbi:MAG: hypothetical protein CBD16_05965 [Betaproteobacteria bacterium TMED156]|nr:MAG: hypothetical protein CBD16_05965 [Betaproteobacteria bacterium TMED156]|tara:strand:- start:289 stop:1494 length:1206 start_codon:yes stop_codon:yes gene_type:complete